MDAKEINKKFRGELSERQTTDASADFSFAESAADLRKQGLDPYGVAMRRALQSVDDDQTTPGGGYKSIFDQKLALLKAAAAKPNITQTELKSVAIALLI